MKSAVDNDVLNKGAWYGLLDELLSMIPASHDEVVILGAAKYVIGKKLEKQAKKGSAEAALALKRFLDALAKLPTIEPTEEEVAFAAELEHAAVTKGVALDSGESLLCAVAIARGIERLVTGDKRAIAAMAGLMESAPRLAELVGRVLSIEQLVLSLVRNGTAETIRAAVCGQPQVDRSLTICFSCTNPASVAAHWIEGLESYVSSLRKDSGALLA